MSLSQRYFASVSEMSVQYDAPARDLIFQKFKICHRTLRLLNESAVWSSTVKRVSFELTTLPLDIFVQVLEALESYSNLRALEMFGCQFRDDQVPHGRYQTKSSTSELLVMKRLGKGLGWKVRRLSLVLLPFDKAKMELFSKLISFSDTLRDLSVSGAMVSDSTVFALGKGLATQNLNLALDWSVATSVSAIFLSKSLLQKVAKEANEPANSTTALSQSRLTMNYSRFQAEGYKLLAAAVIKANLYEFEASGSQWETTQGDGRFQAFVNWVGFLTPASDFLLRKK